MVEICKESKGQDGEIFFLYESSNSHFHPHFLQFTLVHNVAPPKGEHLHYWGCHNLTQAIITYPAATVRYTDGSDDPKYNRPSGSAATFNKPPPKTICSILLMKGSHPGEILPLLASISSKPGLPYRNP